jgi:hypothetical protein
MQSEKILKAGYIPDEDMSKVKKTREEADMQVYLE